MEVKDLRTGNFIIGEGDELNRVCTATFLEIEYSHLFRPIPLTEEWLIKFGFEFDVPTDSYYSSDEDCILHIEGYLQKEMTEECYGVKLKHVHQLQNLYFALCGTELKLKN